MTPEETTIETLRRWSQILLWVSIVLPILAALAIGARYYVERYEKKLSGGITSAAIQQARQDASEARSELSALKERTAPRRLSPEQRQAMLPFIAKLRGRPVAFACRLMDGESCDYASELAALFLQAGCQVPEPIKTSLNDLAGYVALSPYGKVDTEIVQLLTSAFQAAGIAARIEAIKENSVGAWYQDVVHIIVGRKAP
jgi:hypothetical protein